MTDRTGDSRNQPNPPQLLGRVPIVAADLRQWRIWLEAEGVPVESEVSRPGGSTGLYSHDPDRHLVGLATSGLWATY